MASGTHHRRVAEAGRSDGQNLLHSSGYPEQVFNIPPTVLEDHNLVGHPHVGKVSDEDDDSSGFIDH
jgi:hypothetical protein